MKKIIIANYKMNPLSASQAIKLAEAEDWPEVFMAPPPVFLLEVKKVLKRAGLAAQDVSALSDSVGPATGELSAAMLKKLGVRLVLIGHSERRALGETNEEISKKIKAVSAAGLKAVLCVGEPLNIRQKGLSAVKKFLAGQLKPVLSGKTETKNLYIAYEPIWAIGTGKACGAAAAAEIAAYLSSLAGAPVLYGGSVSAENAREFLSRPELSGLLVGGLSLKPKEFKKIILDARV